MRRDALAQNMLAAGLRSDVAEQALTAGFTLASLRTATKKALEAKLDRYAVEHIREALQRAPIADDVIQQLVERGDWACCMCWNLDDRRPIILHHIEEHARGGDDTYENLVV